MAAAAGASYLGVVLAAGPRRIKSATAAAIVRAAGGVPVVGVFGGVQASQIMRVAREVGLAGVELAAPNSTAVARRVRAAGFLVWRRIRLTTERELEWISPVREGSSAVVVELAESPGLGDSEVLLPLYLAREARAHLPGHQMVLAGSLTPETVGEAIAAVRPDIVDVSHGVEGPTGFKDPQRIARFMEAVVGHYTIC